MTLLAPLTGAIAAAIALPALLCMYLLKLRRRPVRVSTTLFWAAASRDLEVNSPLRWLRASWLLFLHLLIVLLVVAALARPALTAPGVPPQRAVILIDRSASMRALDGPGSTSRLEDAKARARQAVRDLTSSAWSTRIAVVAFGAEARALTGFTASRGVLTDAIESIEPTDQPGDLRTALDLVGAMTAPTGEEAATDAPARILLFTDGSFRDVPAAALAGELRLVRVGGPEVAAPADDRAPQPAENVGLVALAAQRDAEDPSTMRVFARLQSTHAQPTTVTVALTRDGSLVEARPIDVPALGLEGPGSTGVAFEVRDPRGGAYLVSIERDDLLAADNRASIVVPGARRPRILVIAPEPSSAPEGTTDARWLLTEPLEALQPASLRIAAPDEAAALARDGSESFDLIVFDRVRPDALPPVPTLSFGAGLPAPGLDFAPAPQGAETATDVISWARANPFLRDVSLDSLFISRALLPVPADPAPSVRVTELARGRHGPLVALGERAGLRHVVVPFDLADSNWPVQVSFPIFLAATVDGLTMRASTSAGRAFTTGEVAWFRTPRAPELVLSGAETLRFPVPTPGQGAETEAAMVLGRIERAGIYVAEAAPPSADPVDRALSVNLLDSFESSLRVSDRVTIGARVYTASQSPAAPREVGTWLLLAAAALLTIEWLAFAARARA